MFFWCQGCATARAAEGAVALTGSTKLDDSRFAITNEIRDRDPADFVDIENQ